MAEQSRQGVVAALLRGLAAAVGATLLGMLILAALVVWAALSDIALGYGVCAIFNDLLVTPSMLALELLMGLGIGALCGAITANLRPLRRKRV